MSDRPKVHAMCALDALGIAVDDRGFWLRRAVQPTPHGAECDGMR